MSLEVGAIYEGGVLKPDNPLPLQERERVTIHVKPQKGRVRQFAGILKWTGDPAILRRIAESPSP